ncbi:MAG: hypothetical protein Aurels2KO_10750 [Aureliella sp.]
MLKRIRPTKRAIVLLSVSASCAGAISGARAMMAPSDPCASEVAAYVAAYDALESAQQAELDAQYAVQAAESALEAAYNALLACEVGSGEGEEEYTPSEERQALLASMQSIVED